MSTKKISTDTNKVEKEEEKKLDPIKTYWEEVALIMQEYFQALDRFRQDPLNPVKHQIF